MDSSLRPRLIVDQLLPDCAEALLNTDTSLACRTEDSLSLLELPDLTPRWEVETDIINLFSIASGHIYGHQSNSHHLNVFDQQTGGIVPGTSKLRMDFGRSPLGNHPHRFGIFNNNYGRIIDIAEGDFRDITSSQIKHVWADANGQVLWLINNRAIWRDWDGEVRSEAALHPITPDRPKSGETIISSVDVVGDKMLLGHMEGNIELRSRDGSVLLQPTFQLAQGNIAAVKLSPGGVWAAAVDETGAAWLWPTMQSEQRIRFPGNTQSIRFPDDATLLVLTDRLRQWALPAPGAPSRLDATGGVSSLDWRGDLIGAALGNGTIRAWRLPDRQRTDVYLSEVISGKDVAIGPGGVRFISATLMRRLHLSRFGEEGTDLDWPGVTGCRRLLWLEDDLMVCASQLNGPAVRSLSGTEHPSLRRAGAEIIDAEPDAERSRAIIGTRSGEVLLLESAPTPSIRLLFRLGGISAVALSGDQIATTQDRTLQLRSLDGTERWRSTTKTDIRDVAFSHDGTLIAAGERNGLVHIWRAEDGTLLAVIGAHTERAQSVVFSPDDTRLATGSWDETVRLWDLTVLQRSPEDLLEEVSAAWGVTLDEALSSDLSH